MNREQEEYIFNAFKDLYSEFPLGQYIRSEQPDFVIKSRDKTIGVEITQIFIDNYRKSNFNEKRKESLQSLLGNSLCEKLELVIPFKFVLSIDFGTKDFSINQIAQIVFTCESYFKNLHFALEDFTSINIENLGQFPVEIDSINIFKYSSLEKSFFSQSAAGVLPDMTLQYLQPILNKKEKALKNYKPCDEHWLLIEEGTFLSDSFGDICIENFSTYFNKVFLYRHAKGELVQLK